MVYLCLLLPEVEPYMTLYRQYRDADDACTQLSIGTAQWFAASVVLDRVEQLIKTGFTLNEALRNEKASLWPLCQDRVLLARLSRAWVFGPELGNWGVGEHVLEAGLQSMPVDDRW